MKNLLQNAIPETLKETLIIRAFGLLKIPMIFFLSPTVVELSDQRVVVKIPLTRRSRNHLNSMYFGSLAVGADCAGGLIAMRMIQKSKANVSLVFKDFQAEFLKRPEGDVHFTCEDGDAIRDLVQKTLQSGERENLPVKIVATVPKLSGTEPVARFLLTLSLKKKS